MNLQSQLLDCSFLILGFPILSFFIIFFFLQKIKKNIITTVSFLLSIFYLLISFYLILLVWGKPFKEINFLWFNLSSNITFLSGFLYDIYSVLLLFVVSLVSLAVNIFSIAYMRDDRNLNRYFAYLQLFVFSMFGLVLSNNLLVLFIFWELVGFASFLLIGFWNFNLSPAKASLKAFLFNKTADLGFFIGLMVIYYYFHTFNIIHLKQLFLSFYNSIFWFQFGVVGFLIASMGKSAQFPFQAWLPDAMEGPTPVSALIHAATMVAAGVFLLISISFIFNIFWANSSKNQVCNFATRICTDSIATNFLSIFCL